MRIARGLVPFAFVCFSVGLFAATAPEPTLADASCGPHARNVLDFWRALAASATRPAPLVVFIHGGGWSKGDKLQVRESALVQQCLDAGVSFAAINDRFRANASLPEILRDCARADCDLIGLGKKSAPPIVVSSARPDLALDNASQFLHHPTHSQRRHARARELGVPVVASIPALGIAPPNDGPTTLCDFLFQHPGVGKTK